MFQQDIYTTVKLTTAINVSQGFESWAGNKALTRRGKKYFYFN